MYIYNKDYVYVEKHALENQADLSKNQGTLQIGFTRGNGKSRLAKHAIEEDHRTNHDTRVRITNGAYKTCPATVYPDLQIRYDVHM